MVNDKGYHVDNTTLSCMTKHVIWKGMENIIQTKSLLFYNVQTTSRIFVGKVELLSSMFLHCVTPNNNTHYLK